MKINLGREFARVAIVKWGDHDGISDAIGIELANLGYKPSYFRFDLPTPIDVDVVFSFGPFGRFNQIPKQITVKALRHQIVKGGDIEIYLPKTPEVLINIIAIFSSKRCFKC